MVFLALLVPVAFVVGALAASPPVGCLETPFPPECQPVIDGVNAALTLERNHSVVEDITTDPFYQLPDEISSYGPGDSIRMERVASSLLEKYLVPPGLTLYRMLYASTDMGDQLVPASAFILIPYTRPRKRTQPLEVIAWAHGTSGIERQCAPSIQDDLYYQYEAPFSMALQGFAVIAPDYAGQGTNTTFNYLAGPSHGADMANAVIAARNHEAFRGVLSDKWVAVGHSEGGLTAWATNEREARIENPTPGFLGAVAIGPALANLQIISTNINKTNGSLGDTLLYPSYTLSTIARLNTSVNTSEYLTAVGLERTELASKGCFNTAVAAFKNLTFDDVFTDRAWLNATFATNWETLTGVRGEKQLAGPMLVVAGQNDSAVPLSVIEDAWNTQCTTYTDAKVHLSEYPGMEHDAVAWASQLEYFDWIRDLFNGVGPTECDRAIIDPSTPGVSGGSGEETSNLKRSLVSRK